MRIRGLIVGCVVVMGVLACDVVPASAGHANLCPGSTNAFCAGSYSWASEVAVDNSANPETSGDVYMTQLGVAGPSSVMRFTAAGEPAPFTGANPNIEGNVLKFSGEIGAVGMGVDSATGDFYVTHREADDVEEFTREGEPVGSFGLPAGAAAVGVAVDNTAGSSKGDLYVSNNAAEIVEKYGPDGKLVAESTVNPDQPLVPRAIAVAPDGSVYVSNVGGEVQKFSEALALEGTIGSNGSQELAIDPSNGDIYIDYSTYIQEYTPTGTPIAEPFGSFVNSFGIAVSGVGASAHHVYASDRGAAKAFIFTIAPTAVTGIAKHITHTTAELCGTVNPESETLAANYQFQYGTNTEYDQVVPASPVSVGTGEVAKEVCTVADGLTVGTPYHFRLVASNGEGTADGQDVSFETPQAVEGLATGQASNVISTNATLNGSLKPDEIETRYYFQYGESEAYGLTSPLEPGTLVNAANGVEVPASTDIAGLKSGTVYHFRLVATNVAGTTYGRDVTFLTEPGVDGQSAALITQSSAILTALVNPNGSDVKYHFEYGTTTAHGRRIPLGDADAGAGVGDRTVSGQVTGLQPATVYHYAVVVTNATGSIVGTDETFQTSSTTPPVVATGAASGVSENAATISGSVGPQGVPTSYEFDVGTDTTYGSRIYGEVGSGKESVTVVLGLQGLAANTVYHYRLVATNMYGTVYGADETFGTGGFPTALLVSPSGTLLIPVPVFAPPSTAGAVVVGTAPKHKAKTKKRRKSKKRAKKAGGVARRNHKKGRGGR